MRVGGCATVAGTGSRAHARINLRVFGHTCLIHARDARINNVCKNKKKRVMDLIRGRSRGHDSDGSSLSGSQR